MTISIGGNKFRHLKINGKKVVTIYNQNDELIFDDDDYYDRVNYIQSDGNQAIDLGAVHADADGRCYVQVDFSDVVTIYPEDAFFGNYSKGPTLVYDTAYLVSKYGDYSGLETYRSDITTRKKYGVMYTDHKVCLMLSGAVYIQQEITAQDNGYDHIYVFARGVNGTTVRNGIEAKCYEIEFEEYNSEKLDRFLVPCILKKDIPNGRCANPSLSHKKGDVGMWDTLNLKFYANCGSGKFTYG